MRSSIFHLQREREREYVCVSILRRGSGISTLPWRRKRGIPGPDLGVGTYDGQIGTAYHLAKLPLLHKLHSNNAGHQAFDQRPHFRRSPLWGHPPGTRHSRASEISQPLRLCVGMPNYCLTEVQQLMSVTTRLSS